jgi:hypothetical protein
VKSIARLLLFLVVFHGAVSALEEVQLEIESFESQYFNTEEVTLVFDPKSSSQASISLRVANISSPFFPENFSLFFECIDSDLAGESINCDKGMGRLIFASNEVIEIAFSLDMNLPNKSGELHLSAMTKTGEVKVNFLSDSLNEWQATVVTEKLQIPFLSNFLSTSSEVFKNHDIVNGQANIEARLEGLGNQLSSLSLNAELTKLGIEGDSILDEVTVHTVLEMKKVGDNWSFINNLSLLEGEMYIQPGFEIMGETPGFYVDIPAEPVIFRLGGNWFPGKKIIELQDLHYLHPEILQLRGSVRLVVADDLDFSDLTLRASIQYLAKAYPTYVQPILLQTNFSDLELSGGIDLSLDYEDSDLEQIELFVDNVFLEDAANRFGLYGLSSHLALDSNASSLISTLKWNGMSFYKLDFGPGNIIFESLGKDVEVLEWQDVSILDGGLKIDELSLRNLASSEFELELGGSLTPISMEELTHVLGWTIFPGKLSGEISGLKYAKNNLYLQGDITVKLFGGELNIQKLRVEDLFSTYSILTTDIAIERLDLEQLTDVFTFGKIEGSLNGKMNKLRLENWQPSYFEMEFSTPEDDDKPHRISQKALENLNELGGGLSGTLSQGFLRFLPAYSYGRLGLGCRLYKGVCELSGVEDDGDSFSILTKGGLFPPWVEVKGAGRSIKWDDLIDGLKQIAEGEVAIE